MDDNQVERAACDVVEELAVDLTGVGTSGSRNDLRVLFDVPDAKPVEVFAGLLQLPATVLIGCRDASIDSRGFGSGFAHVFEDTSSDYTTGGFMRKSEYHYV
ncbi:hypothetical protein C464_16787 [Halorubrum coriense DSM 10284]|uniref:Uncharacterized protein n=1 Tax=Halorubrum coriense DSM 10284 TaxID=1227466 RepID=M0E939_9EURY|nr:hypothetical protein C464_16787 [Halorubrum coriense DSM 10284]